MGHRDLVDDGEALATSREHTGPNMVDAPAGPRGQHRRQELLEDVLSKAGSHHFHEVRHAVGQERAPDRDGMAVVATKVEAGLCDGERLLAADLEESASVPGREQEIVVRKHDELVAPDKVLVAADQIVQRLPLRPCLVLDENAVLGAGRGMGAEARQR